MPVHFRTSSSSESRISVQREVVGTTEASFADLSKKVSLSLSPNILEEVEKNLNLSTFTKEKADVVQRIHGAIRCIRTLQQNSFEEDIAQVLRVPSTTWKTKKEWENMAQSTIVDLLHELLPPTVPAAKEMMPFVAMPQNQDSLLVQRHDTGLVKAPLKKSSSKTSLQSNQSFNHDKEMRRLVREAINDIENQIGAFRRGLSRRA